MIYNEAELFYDKTHAITCAIHSNLSCNATSVYFHYQSCSTKQTLALVWKPTTNSTPTPINPALIVSIQCLGNTFSELPSIQNYPDLPYFMCHHYSQAILPLIPPAVCIPGTCGMKIFPPFWERRPALAIARHLYIMLKNWLIMLFHNFHFFIALCFMTKSLCSKNSHYAFSIMAIFPSLVPRPATFSVARR